MGLHRQDPLRRLFDFPITCNTHKQAWGLAFRPSRAMSAAVSFVTCFGVASCSIPFQSMKAILLFSNGTLYTIPMALRNLDQRCEHTGDVPLQWDALLRYVMRWQPPFEIGVSVLMARTPPFLLPRVILLGSLRKRSRRIARSGTDYLDLLHDLHDLLH